MSGAGAPAPPQAEPEGNAQPPNRGRRRKPDDGATGGDQPPTRGRRRKPAATGAKRSPKRRRGGNSGAKTGGGREAPAPAPRGPAQKGAERSDHRTQPGREWKEGGAGGKSPRKKRGLSRDRSPRTPIGGRGFTRAQGEAAGSGRAGARVYLWFTMYSYPPVKCQADKPCCDY